MSTSYECSALAALDSAKKPPQSTPPEFARTRCSDRLIVQQTGDLSSTAPPITLPSGRDDFVSIPDDRGLVEHGERKRQAGLPSQRLIRPSIPGLGYQDHGELPGTSGRLPQPCHRAKRGETVPPSRAARLAGAGGRERYAITPRKPIKDAQAPPGPCGMVLHPRHLEPRRKDVLQVALPGRRVLPHAPVRCFA